MRKSFDVQPSANRLIGSLRDVGYSFDTAIADLVDNSIEAGATTINIRIRYDGPFSHVTIHDNGHGMSAGEITESLRFGAEREYSDHDLGKYGLGLKTASISQCKRLTVVSRKALKRPHIHVRRLDLERIRATDRWEITDADGSGVTGAAIEQLKGGPGTVVVWEQLDRVFGSVDPNSSWAKRRLVRQTTRLEQYLGMVFHRFIEGRTQGMKRGIRIVVNGKHVPAWNPFALTEPTLELPVKWFELSAGSKTQSVTLRRFVLPPRDAFSSPEEFDRMGGLAKWNRQQGLYIYRSDRLIQAGGWSGMRTLDEHTKLARASLDFPSSLDNDFRVNVAKMRVAIPPEVRSNIEPPIQELCKKADAVYREDSARRTAANAGPEKNSPKPPIRLDGAALAIRVSALASGMSPLQIRDFEAHLREHSPEVAASLGF